MGSNFDITCVGLINSLFQKAKLIDLCHDKSGVQTGPFGSLLHKEDYVDEGTPIITVEHLGDNIIVSNSDTPNVSDADKERLSKFQLKEGDIVFSRVGSVDRRGYVSNKEDGWLFSGRCLRVRVDKQKICSKYLSYYFGFEGFKQYIRGIAVGATMPSINTKILSEVEVYYPEYQQQLSIARYLSSIDNKINLNKQTNQTLELMAQTLFKSWFVDFDPVFDNALINAMSSIPKGDALDQEKLLSLFSEELYPKAKLRLGVIQNKLEQSIPIQDQVNSSFPNEFEHNEQLGWIPKGWEDIAVNEMVSTVSETYPLKSIEKIIFLNTGDILDGKFLHKNYSKTLGLPGQAKKSIKKGDILYSEIRPKNKRFALVNFDGSEHVVSTKLMVLRPNEGFEELFPYFVLTQNKNISILQRAAESRSGTFPQITYTELGMIRVALPQNKKLITLFIERHLKNHFARKDQIDFQNETLTKLRDSLLPKLISGELQIPDMEKLVKETA